MTRALLMLTLLVGVSFLAPGCMTAAKEAYGGVTGADGIVAEIQPAVEADNDRPLGRYTHFEIGKVTDDISGKYPDQILDMVPDQFEKQLAKKKIVNAPTGKTLIIRGTIIHYEDEGMLGMVLGPLEEIICRTELVDKDTGKVIGVANCIGRTTERVNKGVAKKAEGLAKAWANWIEMRYPKPQKD